MLTAWSLVSLTYFSDLDPEVDVISFLISLRSSRAVLTIAVKCKALVWCLSVCPSVPRALAADILKMKKPGGSTWRDQHVSALLYKGRHTHKHNHFMALRVLSRTTWMSWYHRNLYCCSTKIISSNPSLSLNPLLGTLSCSFTPHIHLSILISALWSATSFSFPMGQVSLPCNILFCTQLL